MSIVFRMLFSSITRSLPPGGRIAFHRLFIKQVHPKSRPAGQGDGERGIIRGKCIQRGCPSERPGSVSIDVAGIWFFRSEITRPYRALLFGRHTVSRGVAPGWNKSPHSGLFLCAAGWSLVILFARVNLPEKGSRHKVGMWSTFTVGTIWGEGYHPGKVYSKRVPP